MLLLSPDKRLVYQLVQIGKYRLTLVAAEDINTKSVLKGLSYGKSSQLLGHGTRFLGQYRLIDKFLSSHFFHGIPSFVVFT